MSILFRGEGVSGGLAIGEIFRLSRQKLKAPEGKGEAPELEVKCFQEALERAQSHLQELYEDAKTKLGEQEAEIFDAHLTMLQDEYSVSEPICESILNEGLTAAQAVERQFDALRDMFLSFEDALFRERAADAEDLKEQLLGEVLGVKPQDLSHLDGQAIILADELMPSDTMRMDMSHVVGLATCKGGATSHTVVIARTLGIPAVVGLTGWEDQVFSGMPAAINGASGELIVQPEDSILDTYRKEIEVLKRQTQALEIYKTLPTVTTDGTEIGLFANIGAPAEAETARDFGAEGVGLFRSEFLFMDRSTLPTEEEQFQAYRQVLETMKGKPVIVRTLDVGGDKKLPCLPLPEEDNPFLGFRAIRMTLKRPEVFRPQLRALLRASVYGELQVMFPMISNLSELRAAKALLAQERADLEANGVPTGEIKIGIMVEIPAVAVCADLFAREVDFFSIGTNDLIQYTLAAERGNMEVNELYTAYHPAVLWLIANTARAAQENGIVCGMCGEAGGDPKLTAILAGMGLRELSMSPRLIPATRKLLREIGLEECRARAEKLLSLPDPAAIVEYLDSL